MKVLVSIIHFLSCLALTWGYLPSQTLNNNVFKATIATSTSLELARQGSLDNRDEITSRRKFVVQTVTAASTVFGGLLIASPESAFAAAPPQTTQTKADQAGSPPRNKRVGGLVNKIRNIGKVMDELQRDLMQERWDLLGDYPAQLRSFVPLFTTYTDSAFSTDAPTDKGLRVALRYEVGRYFAALERFKQATSRQALEEAYIAYADMSLHFDRYLRVGGLYTYYDDSISNERYYKGISDDTLVYTKPANDPPVARDLVIIIQGPDKGETGILLAKYTDGSNHSVVKLDRVKGMREIRVVNNSWVAKRQGEQDPDDVFLIPRKGEKSQASS